MSVDCKYIIEKSEDYDTLIIWKRDVVEVDIPNSNKVIGPYSFNFSNLERITIPASVTRIYKNAFDYCNYLVRVEFDPNSQLQTIEEKAFSFADIERIKIPASVTKICKHAFSFCEQLVRVEFQPNSQIREIDIEAFYGYNSNLRSISIPASVSKIF